MRSVAGRLRVLAALAALLPVFSSADPGITIAVASNFAKTAAEVSGAFTEASGVPVRISAGSTGKLYAQIINGAPFDVFLAADTERPSLLEQSGHTVSGSRRTYATGSLVLWSRDEALRGRDCRKALQQGEYARLALANPRTAPYGAAAREFLVGASLWEAASKRAVYGENIAQTLQFAATGNATMGFIASAQAMDAALPAATCSWRVPMATHRPLQQQLVILRRAAGNADAQRFVDFLGSAPAKYIVGRHGYRVSD